MRETYGLTGKMARTKSQVKKMNSAHTRRRLNLYFDVPKGVRRMMLDLAIADAWEDLHEAHLRAMTSDTASWLEKRRQLKRAQDAFKITSATRLKLYDK